MHDIKEFKSRSEKMNKRRSMDGLPALPAEIIIWIENSYIILIILIKLKHKLVDNRISRIIFIAMQT